MMPAETCGMRHTVLKVSLIPTHLFLFHLSMINITRDNPWFVQKSMLGVPKCRNPVYAEFRPEAAGNLRHAVWRLKDISNTYT